MGFHLEIRQFPHSARAFNVERVALDALLRDWVAGRVVRWGEREWEPRKAKLTVLEGPALAPSEIGMGRGWPEAQRRARDVTSEMLGAARGAQPGQGADHRPAVRAALDPAPVTLRDLVARVREPGADPRAVEAAVWALLQAGELELVSRRER